MPTAGAGSVEGVSPHEISWAYILGYKVSGLGGLGVKGFRGLGGLGVSGFWCFGVWGLGNLEFDFGLRFNYRLGAQDNNYMGLGPWLLGSSLHRQRTSLAHHVL